MAANRNAYAAEVAEREGDDGMPEGGASVLGSAVLAFRVDRAIA